MSIGLLVRKLCGDRSFPAIGRRYRSLFVDLEALARVMSLYIPENGFLLDVGGGDGEPLNHLMALRGDIRVVMIDLKADIGASIRENFRGRTTVLPGTSVRQFLNMNHRPPDCIVVSDVIHHVPPANRRIFFEDLYDLMKWSNARLLIKDVEPGYLISRLGRLSDRWISGDPNVQPISGAELCELIRGVFEDVSITESTLICENKPNYLIAVDLRRSDPQKPFPHESRPPAVGGRPD